MKPLEHVLQRYITFNIPPVMMGHPVRYRSPFSLSLILSLSLSPPKATLYANTRISIITAVIRACVYAECFLAYSGCPNFAAYFSHQFSINLLLTKKSIARKRKLFRKSKHQFIFESCRRSWIVTEMARHIVTIAKAVLKDVISDML